MSLRAVFFDIDDTLYSSTRFAWRAREQAVEAMIRAGLRAGSDRVLVELQELVVEFGSNDYRHYNRLLQ
ncbi:MAG: haloacid dehalogenase, partial [Planctomycetes bacterium]|nr:haloacid dehalogenase [Planctomycetota bacterium]